MCLSTHTPLCVSVWVVREQLRLQERQQQQRRRRHLTILTHTHARMYLFIYSIHSPRRRRRSWCSARSSATTCSRSTGTTRYTHTHAHTLIHPSIHPCGGALISPFPYQSALLCLGGCVGWMPARIHDSQTKPFPRNTRRQRGWHAPKISAYHDLSISPAASVLHYGLEVRVCASSLLLYVCVTLESPRDFRPLRRRRCLCPVDVFCIWIAVRQGVGAGSQPPFFPLIPPPKKNNNTTPRYTRSLASTPKHNTTPLQCFEGMKAYKDVHGKLRLFRPDLNMERLNSSLARLYMPVGKKMNK